MAGPSLRPLPSQFAFIKRVGGAAFEEESFAKLQLGGCADVADVAVRVCKEFPHWGVHAEQVCLFLAAGGGEVRPPALAAAANPAARLGEGLTLDRAGITPGSWLLARVPPPAAAACGASPWRR
jgi:hypothetical protein